MDPTIKPANADKYTVHLNRRDANRHYTGPASATLTILSLPTPFPQQAARITMDNVLWRAGLGKYSVCPAPRRETEQEWRARMVKGRAPQPRDYDTGRFVAREPSPQAELPLPSSISDLNEQLARVNVPKRQSKRRPK